jgi:ABC-type multidrug transport system ATPase subunit
LNPAVVAVDLTKAFGDFVAVDHLNFEAPKGVVFGVLGPNGAGKTTLLRMLSTVLRPTGGTASVLGYDIVREPFHIRERIGVLPEDAGLYDRLTPAETLLFYGRLHGIEVPKLLARSESLLSLLGLEEKRDVKVGMLSKGMKQKVALMRAILHEPEVLFLDEPTSGLDVMSAREIRSLITDWAKRGGTVLLSTHNLWEAQQLCNLVAIMNAGRIVSIGTVEGLGHMTHERTLEDVFVHLVRGEVER